MKILHITSSEHTLGGVSQYILSLGKFLERTGHEVTIAGQRPDWHSDAPHLTWVEVPTSGNPMEMFKSVQRLKRLGSFDLVHAHFRKCAIVGRQIAKSQNIPMVYTLHLPKVPMSFWQRKLTDFGDITHVPSIKSRDWLVNCLGVDESKIHLVPHGVDTLKYSISTDEERKQARDFLGLDQDATVAAYVGRFDHPKNENWIADLARQMPNVSFVMMGAGPRQHLLNDAPVTLLPYGDPVLLYRAMDALLLPSSNEGFSLVTAEAMSTGRPVLRTRTDGVDETILEGHNGYSCDIDRDDFIRSSKEFLSNRQELRRLGKFAAGFARKFLDEKLQFEQTMKMYKMVQIQYSQDHK